MKATVNPQRMNTFIIEVPMGMNSTFLRNLANNMGWKTTVKRHQPKNPEMSKEEFIEKINHAKMQSKTGKVSPIFHSAKDAIDYLDSL